MSEDAKHQPNATILFEFSGTLVQLDSGAHWNIGGIALLSWYLVHERYPQHGAIFKLCLTLLWTLLFYLAYFVHGVGHIISARRVGAPMDALRLTTLQWLNDYRDHNISAGQHIGRAVGGPSATALAMAAALLLRFFTPKRSMRYEVLTAFLGFNALVGGLGMLPAPRFDGGALLKWSRVAQHDDLEAAEVAVREAGFAAGVLLAAIGLPLLLMRRWLAALVAIGGGAAAVMDSLAKGSGE